MTAPTLPLEQDPRPLYQRLSGAVREGLRMAAPKAPKTKQAPRAAKAADELAQLGLLAVHVKSAQPDVEDFVDRLWHSIDDEIEHLKKEWDLHLLYCANEQLLAYHRDRRTWIPRRTLPWRVRSVYNVCQKAVNIRVARLVANKPMVSVQSQTADVDDVQKAEYKENLFWYLWERLYLHMKWTTARRWAAKCGSGFLKCGWDPDAGQATPATRKRVRMKEIPGQSPDGITPGVPTQVFDGIEEYFVDAQGNDLGPVLVPEADDLDPTGEQKLTRAPIPPAVQWLAPGEATVSVRAPFNVRMDRYAEHIRESWYIQDGEILPMSKIAAMHPDKIDALREARAANDDEKALRWRGLAPQIDVSSGSYAKNNDGQASHQPLDREYFYLETWIFPKNPLLKRLWGEKGCRIVTVGGIEIERAELPEWAIKACPFIQIVDTLEEGNTYQRSFLRDVIPLQDDINRSRSMRAERIALQSRLLLWAPANHGMNVKALGGMNGVMVTTRSQAHKPEVLKLDAGDPGIREFEQDSIAAAADLGNMNDASTGKLPSAGLAAKAIYALQYADEQSVSETSSLQDTALKELAESLDQITRVEYADARKIRLVGEDRSFMVEHEISPEDLQADVDYTFVPGSMLSRQKESVKNELLELLKVGLVDMATVRKHLSTAVPDVFRTSYNLQEAKARRTLQRILRAAGPIAVQPQPFDDPAVACSVLEEFALTAKWDLIGVEKQQLITQLWQAYKQQQQMAEAAQAAAAAAAQPQPPGGQPAGKPGAGAPPPSGPPIGGPKPFEAAAGAHELEHAAVAAQTPPAPS